MVLSRVSQEEVDRLVTLQEAAQQTGYSEKTLRRFIDKGKYPAEQQWTPKGKRWYFAEATVERIRQHRTMGVEVGQPGQGSHGTSLVHDDQAVLPKLLAVMQQQQQTIEAQARQIAELVEGQRRIEDQLQQALPGQKRWRWPWR